MSALLEWKLLRIVESDEALVSGPGIELLKRTVADMAARGIPNEYNDYGFNKTDWDTYEQLSHYLSQPALPARIATTFVRMLSKYRNTQVPNYQEISRLVTTDFNNMPRGEQPQGASSGDNTARTQIDQEKIHIYGDMPLTYGKVRVYIPHGLDTGDMRAINRIVDEKMEQEGASIVTDRFGNEGYERFKKFSKDRDNPHIVHIHTSVLNPIIELIKSRKNLEVTGHAPGQSAGAIAASGGSSTGGMEQPAAPQASEVELLGKVSTRFGEKLKVKFNVPFERSPYPAIKSAGLTPRAAAYSMDDHHAGRPGIVLIDLQNKRMFDQVRDVIAQKGLDVSPLDHFSQEHFARTSPTSAPSPDAGSETETRPTAPPTDAEARESHRVIRVIHFSDLPENKMKVQVQYNHPELAGNLGKKGFIKELIQYTFPEYTWDRNGYFYEVQGNFQQFATFGELLKRFGYDVSELRDVLHAKLNSGRMQKQKYTGQYDHGDNLEQISRDIDEKLPESTYELYGQQKEGVAFLYGRHHAILGDETGFGKTAQLVTAAALRMKDENHPTLIVTLKATQDQWVSTIKAVCGAEETQNISTDGAQPKKWTVLYYENFSAGKKLPDVMEACKRANFGIAIFDELHKLKHETSKRSKNIAEVVENIPTVWGASATISANKPMDVKNQLAVLKHHLGKIKDSKFKKDFAGASATGYRGAYEVDDNSDQSYAAAERLNKWLNLSGVYVRRSKSDLRDMPTLNRAEPTARQIDQAEFNRKYMEKVRSYDDPSHPLSKLIAAREVIAQLKTDETVNKVIRIVRQNMDDPTNNYAKSKVVVFTNFIESANQLVSKLSAALRQVNPSFKVITYLAMTKKSERKRVKDVFGQDPNAKVLVMSLKMGGTGIDFPNEARNMVVNDFDWTPESAEQSEGRIYRINTNHPVNIDYTLAKGIDEQLYKKVQRKRELAAIIQKYRKELHKKEHDPELLQRIIDAQRELRQLDDEMTSAVANDLPAVRAESFGDFMNNYEVIKKHWFSI